MTGARPPTTGVLGPAEPADPSVRHLMARLAIVEARVRCAVAAGQAIDPEPDDRFRGLYVSEAQVAAILADRPSSPWPAPDAESRGDLAEVESAADAAERAGADIRLRSVALAFGLDSLDVELLLVALAPDIDPRFERLFGYLNDDVSRRRASVGLALLLCGASVAGAAARRRLGSSGPLVAGGLIEVEDPERPFLSRALRVPDRATGHLLGDDSIGPVLGAVMAEAAPPLGEWLDPGAPNELGLNLERGLRHGTTPAYLRERTGADGALAGRMALARLTPAGRMPVVLDLQRLGPDTDLAALAGAAAREARLRRSGLVAGPIEPLADRGAWAVRHFADLPCPVVFHGTRGWDPAWSTRAPLLMELPAATRDERSRAWRAGLHDRPEAAAVADAIDAYPFRISVSGATRAASAARQAAEAADRPVEAADLAAGVRAQNAAGLERLAHRIEPRATWGDLVLRPDIAEHLHDLANRARHRDEVLDGWGLGDPNRGRGLTALFSGDSGTGKTLSAEVLAGALGLDLYVIDLSSVVDKYIGETEKNLDRVFSQADGVNGVLLFDEADAIFGKRSEVRDARDRYANVEIAYLLQRMERFDGMAILTTNLRANLDEAFLRRLDVLVDFPMPDEEQRRLLWLRHLPPALPVADDLDLDFLAHHFRISGGNIRNIVAAAAYRAAAEGRPVVMADLIKGTEREYRKLGHLSTEAEFGPYFDLVAS
jgi:hypothetical protein